MPRPDLAKGIVKHSCENVEWCLVSRSWLPPRKELKRAFASYQGHPLHPRKGMEMRTCGIDKSIYFMVCATSNSEAIRGRVNPI